MIDQSNRAAPHMYPTDSANSCLGYMEGSQYAAYSRAAAAAAAGMPHKPTATIGFSVLKY